MDGRSAVPFRSIDVVDERVELALRFAALRNVTADVLPVVSFIPYSHVVNNNNLVNCLSCFKVIRNCHKAIYCDICCQWEHLRCTNLSKSDYNILSDTDEYYYCSKCLSDALPFNYVDDKLEFLNVILNFLSTFQFSILFGLIINSCPFL